MFISKQKHELIDASSSSEATRPAQSDMLGAVNEAGVSVESITETLKGEEDEAYTSRCLARNKRRLEERWRCTVAGHTYCFADRDGTHIPLTGDEVLLWSQNIHDGEATLLALPKKISAPSISDTSSDTASIKSTGSWKTITYQRPLKRQGELTLTDLRSMRVRELMASDSTSVFSTDTVVSRSSVMSAFKAAVSFGKSRLQGSPDGPEIRRRKAEIDAMVQLVEKLYVDDRLDWIIANEKYLNKAIDDLLELSMDYYGRGYREAAIKLANKLHDLIQGIPFLPHTEHNSWHLLRFKLQPLVSLHLDIAGVHVARDMREILLQEGSDTFDSDQAVQEVALHLCYELAYGPAGLWRLKAYEMLFLFYSANIGRSRLQEIGKQGSLMQDLRDRVFNTAMDDIQEHSSAMHFFSEYAEDMLGFREYLGGPTGIPLLLANLRAQPTPASTSESYAICRVLGYISRWTWLMPVLDPATLCPLLVGLVVSMRSVKDDLNYYKAYMTGSIATVLINIHNRGNATAKKAVREAAADVEFSSSWESNGSMIRRFIGEKYGDQYQSYKKVIIG